MVYILIGFGIGVWSVLSTGIFTMILFGIITGYVIYKNALNNAEGRFLNWVFIVAFSLSIIVSSANFYLAALIKNDSDLIGDAAAYSVHGAYIAEVITNKKWKFETNYINMYELFYWRNVYNGELPTYGDYRSGFFAYLYGLFYTVFGYSPLMFKFFNSNLGIIGCFFIYFWMRDTFGEREAKIALFLTLFLPSRFIWATSGLKDTLVFFAFSLTLFIFSKLQKKGELLLTCVILFAAFLENNFIYAFSLLFVAVLILNRKRIISLLGSFVFTKLAYILVYGIRKHFVEPIIISLGISLFAFLKRSRIFILIAILAILPILFLFKSDKDTLKERYQTLTLKMIETQLGQAQEGEYAKSKYRIYPDRFHDTRIPLNEIPTISFKELFISYLIGMSYHFLSPLPWSLSSKGLMFGYIQSVLIYFLLPFIALGILIGFRYHWRETFPYFLLILMIASINSLFIGNMGTLFRHRDMVMPFFIAFGAIGLTKVFMVSKFDDIKLTMSNKNMT